METPKWRLGIPFEGDFLGFHSFKLKIDDIASVMVFQHIKISDSVARRAILESFFNIMYNICIANDAKWVTIQRHVDISSTSSAILGATMIRATGVLIGQNSHTDR